MKGLKSLQLKKTKTLLIELLGKIKKFIKLIENDEPDQRTLLDNLYVVLQDSSYLINYRMKNVED